MPRTELQIDEVEPLASNLDRISDRLGWGHGPRRVADLATRAWDFPSGPAIIYWEIDLERSLASQRSGGYDQYNPMFTCTDSTAEELARLRIFHFEDVISNKKI